VGSCACGGTLPRWLFHWEGDEKRPLPIETLKKKGQLLMRKSQIRGEAG